MQLKKLPTPNKEQCPACISSSIFPYFDHDSLYFLYTDKTYAVIKYNLTLGNHRTLPKSKSQIVLEHYPHGIRIGNFFWILGSIPYEDASSYELIDVKTLLWSIKRQKWIQAPILPFSFDERLSRFKTAAINSTTVLIFSCHFKPFTKSYDFSLNTWKKWVLQ